MKFLLPLLLLSSLCFATPINWPNNSILTSGTTGQTIVSGGTGTPTYGFFSGVTGVGNLFLGSVSPTGLTTGTNDTFVGKNTYNITSGADNTYVGWQSGDATTTGIQNTLVGSGAGHRLTTGTTNTFIGYNAGLNATSGQGNIMIGDNAGGSGVIVDTFNVGIGHASLFHLSNGETNAAVGYNTLAQVTSGFNNVGVGLNACQLVTNQNNNTCVGPNSEITANTFTNSTALGNGASAGASNVVSLGNSSVNVGIASITIPTARLHLPAVTTAASSSSLKIPSGTIMTTPENGAIENDGTHFYWTNDSGTRVDLAASGGTPGGATTQVQFNDAGAFNGTAGLTFDKTNVRLGINQATAKARLHANSSTTSGTVGTDAIILGNVHTTNNIGAGALIEGGNFEGNTASGQDAHSEGQGTFATGQGSHAEGLRVKATALWSHAEGASSNPGVTGIASGTYSHHEGVDSISSGEGSHTEGEDNIASGLGSHAEGAGTTATHTGSHAEGGGTLASGNNSHAAGTGTTAQADNQTAVGQYNVGVGTPNSPSVTDEMFSVGVGADSLNKSTGFSVSKSSLVKINNGHLKTIQTTAPTASPNANAGTGATCTVSNATDIAGKINLTTTATAPASGAQCAVTFNVAYSVAPICTVTDANNNSVLFSVVNGVFFTTTTTTLVINYSNADATGHANVWTYSCIETQ